MDNVDNYDKHSNIKGLHNVKLVDNSVDNYVSYPQRKKGNVEKIKNQHLSTKSYPQPVDYFLFNLLVISFIVFCNASSVFRFSEIFS